jgi:hypothetical protein
MTSRPLKGRSRYWAGWPLPVAQRHTKPGLPKLKVNSKNFSKSSRASLTEPGERARVFALDALIYIANDQNELARFLAETGFNPADLRSMAHEPGFAAAMLDYLRSNEPLLIAFAAAHGIAPTAIEMVQQSLEQSSPPDT